MNEQDTNTTPRTTTNTTTTRRQRLPTRPAPADSSTLSWFQLPQSLRRVFDRFPLVAYPPSPLPQRAPRHQNEHILYVFQSEEPACRDAPSFNPSCLKWQAYLKFHGIPLRTRSSNNHASPTGSLPFLLPASKDLQRPASPVPSNRIARWVVSQGGKEEAVHIKQEAYTALIDHTIRSAWLHYLYLDHDNFHAVAWPMYVSSASNSYPIQTSLAYQLQNAARDELLKTNTVVDAQELYAKADKAFQSLSTLLGDNKFFFAQSTPGLFDASLFAYTQIILDDQLDWKSTALKLVLQNHDNLVRHRARLIRGFFSS